MKFVLVGAGGHSKVLVEMIYASGGSLAAYIDREPADWLDAPQFKDDNPKTAPVGPIVIGIGAVNPESLQRRLVLLDSYLAAGRDLPPIIHPAATVSASAAVDAGALVLAGAAALPRAARLFVRHPAVPTLPCHHLQQRAPVVVLRRGAAGLVLPLAVLGVFLRIPQRQTVA